MIGSLHAARGSSVIMSGQSVPRGPDPCYLHLWEDIHIHIQIPPSLVETHWKMGISKTTHYISHFPWKPCHGCYKSITTWWHITFSLLIYIEHHERTCHFSKYKNVKWPCKICSREAMKEEGRRWVMGNWRRMKLHQFSSFLPSFFFVHIRALTNLKLWVYVKYR